MSVHVAALIERARGLTTDEAQGPTTWATARGAAEHYGTLACPWRAIAEVGGSAIVEVGGSDDLALIEPTEEVQ